MPTGFTAKLMEEGQTFREFVMLCVRGTGAAITMRDESFDIPVPEKFEPSDYHINALKEARDKVKQLEAMTQKERLQYGKEKIDQTIKSMKESSIKRKIEQERLDTMAAKVKAWKVGAEYLPFKEFMLNQLEISGDSNNYYENALKNYNEKSPIELFNLDLDMARKDIDYHIEKQAEEVKRVNERNKYLVGLREALKTVKD